MTWLDFVSFIAIVLMIGGGYKRGIVLEIADLAWFVLGGFFAFRMYRPIASAMHNSVFKQFSLGFLEKSILFTVLVVAALVIYGIAFNTQRKIKEDKTLDANVDSTVGAVLGTGKAILYTVTVLGLLFFNNAFPGGEMNQMKRGPVVSTLTGFKSLMKPVYYIIAPSDLVEKFLEEGLGGPK